MLDKILGSLAFMVLFIIGAVYWVWGDMIKGNK
jgi:hypothetical protein